MASPNRKISRAKKKALSTMTAVELAMTLGMSKMMRLFLDRVVQNYAGVPVLEGGEEYPISSADIVTLGEIAGWWEETLNADLALLVFDVWTDIKKELRIQQTSMEPAFNYAMAVRDRLVRGITPPLPEDAFNKIRQGLAEGALRGYSTEQLAQRIAADLSWETNGPYWRGVKEGIDAQIDAILDPYGSPGNAVREAARLYDTKVQTLRNLRNVAINNLDREKSYWQVRAERIARTESTGIYNAVTYQSMIDAQSVAKMWIATEDHRTRPSHAEANNQIVKIYDNFVVGGSSLLMPGDPRGPAQEVINCRCTMIGLSAREVLEIQSDGTLYGMDIGEVEIPNELLVASIEAFYSDSQPRDGRGRWRKTGGFGGIDTGSGEDLSGYQKAARSLDAVARMDPEDMYYSPPVLGDKVLDAERAEALSRLQDEMAEVARVNDLRDFKGRPLGYVLHNSTEDSVEHLLGYDSYGKLGTLRYQIGESAATDPDLRKMVMEVLYVPHPGKAGEYGRQRNLDEIEPDDVRTLVESIKADAGIQGQRDEWIPPIMEGADLGAELRKHPDLLGYGLNNYVGYSYAAMNRRLREGAEDHADMDPKIEAFKREFQTHGTSLRQDAYAFRGVVAIRDPEFPRPDDFNPGDWKVGTTLEDPGFLSVTSEPGVAAAFARGGDGRKNWTMVYKIPAGGPRFMPGYEGHKEFIFEPGTQSKVLHVDPVKRQVFLEMQPSTVVASAEQFYAPGQPRDGRGRWAKAPGGYIKADSMTAKGSTQEVLDSMAGQDLEGLPGRVKVGKRQLEFHSNAHLQSVADSYRAARGLGPRPTDYVKVRPEVSERIAQAFEDMKHDPDSPEVKRAYGALKDETLAQYQALTDAGYKFDFYPKGKDPYPVSPREAIMDLAINKRMYVYPTLGDDGGFGDDQIGDNPLLDEVPGVRWGNKPVTYNDVFRAVHDAFGHGKEGVGFRADGEDNAYRQHFAMFTPEAQRALATETRGQNSWLNFGPHGESNRTASTADTVFADQKTGLLPDWAIDPDIHKEAS